MEKKRANKPEKLKKFLLDTWKKENSGVFYYVIVWVANQFQQVPRKFTKKAKLQKCFKNQENSQFWFPKKQWNQRFSEQTWELEKLTINLS